MKRINKFHIINIKMEGFKKFKEPYSIEFDRFTCISGGNGQGKSTIADAISYAFCGTPFWGEKSCDRLLNSESREMYVEVQFVDENGEIHTLSRRRSGNNTTIVLDTMNLRQTGIYSFRDSTPFPSLGRSLRTAESFCRSLSRWLSKRMYLHK